MAITIEEVKKNIAYKQLPIATLDERWYRLFPEENKTPEIKSLEVKLNDLIKRQGKITTDLKALRKIKKDLMQGIINNADNDDISESKRMKVMAKNQKLILEAKDEIRKLEQEELDIPEKIRDANIELIIQGIEVSYNRIHTNYKEIQILGNRINELRTELKEKVVIKQEKEIQNTEIYSYMHNLLGPDMIEIFDKKDK